MFLPGCICPSFAETGSWRRLVRRLWAVLVPQDSLLSILGSWNLKIKPGKRTTKAQLSGSRELGGGEEDWSRQEVLDFLTFLPYRAVTWIFNMNILSREWLASPHWPSFHNLHPCCYFLDSSKHTSWRCGWHQQYCFYFFPVHSQSIGTSCFTLKQC